MDPALHAAPDHECRYDAFISYRHLPLDRAVAMRLQTLLENYRPPRSMTGLKNKRIRRVFRDQSELPTSGDLGSDIRTALLSSRYLIVICSEQFRDSVWCMEEVRQFKAAHGGRTDRILTLLVSGEPKDVFPPELTEEVRPGREGEGEHIEHIEPLSGDVRAPTIRKSLRLLNTEFLRIAAPLLGCGFDDLYQRHQRRRRRRLTALIGGTAGVLGCVLCVVSVFAYRTWVSEGNYRRALATTYLRSAAEYAVDDDPQRALMYYTEALALEPGDATAAAGAATLLQSCAWPMLEQTAPGCLNGGQIQPDNPLTSNAAGTRFLSGSGYVNAITVQDAAGAQVAVLPQGYTFIDGEGKDLWAFAGDDLLLYDTATDTQYTLPWPTDQSRGCAPDSLDLEVYSPSVQAAGPGRALVAYGGLVRLYALEKGTASLLASADLADALPEDGDAMGIFCFNELYVSDSGALAVVTNYSTAVLYDARDLTLKAVIPEYINTLIGVSFSPDDSCLALNYGNLYPTDYANPVSFAAVYDTAGQCLFLSPEKLDETILGTRFHPSDTGCLLVWGRTFARLWDWRTGVEIAAPLFVENAVAAAFTSEDVLTLDDGAGQVRSYRFRQLAPAASDAAPDSLPQTQTGSGELSPDGETTFSCFNRTLTMTGPAGTATAELPGLANRLAYDADSGWLYLYNTVQTGFWRLRADLQAGTLGSVETLDTGGEKIAELWFGNDLLFAQTNESRLLVYDADGAPVRTILPEHTGSLQSVLADPGGVYLAVVLKPIVGELGEYRFTETGVLELWNLQDGNLVAGFETPEGRIRGAAFTDDGALVWTDGDTTSACRIVLPRPDAADLSGLRTMLCLELDGGDVAVCDPGACDLGGWTQVLGAWQGFVPAPAADDPASGDELAALVQQFMTREDAGSDAWYADMDEVWQRIGDGTLAAPIIDLDDLFYLYVNCPEAMDPGRLQTGVQTYCDWYAAIDWSVGEEIVQSRMDRMALMALDVSGGEYDQAFCTLWRGMGHAVMTEENLVYLQQLREQMTQAMQDYDQAATEQERQDALQAYDECKLLGQQVIMEIINAQLLLAFADMLDGTDPFALYDPVNNSLSQGDGNGMNLLGLNYQPLYVLICGEAEESARSLDETMTLFEGMYVDDDLLLATVQAVSQWVSVLTQRGTIPAETTQLWLASLDHRPVLQITALTPDQQAAGLRQGDGILAVNGEPILSSGQVLRLKQQGLTSLTVLRDGAVVDIPFVQEALPACQWVLSTQL